MLVAVEPGSICLSACPSVHPCVQDILVLKTECVLVSQCDGGLCVYLTPVSEHLEYQS